MPKQIVLIVPILGNGPSASVDAQLKFLNEHNARIDNAYEKEYEGELVLIITATPTPKRTFT